MICLLKEARELISRMFLQQQQQQQQHLFFALYIHTYTDIDKEKITILFVFRKPGAEIILRFSSQFSRF